MDSTKTPAKKHISKYERVREKKKRGLVSVYERQKVKAKSVYDKCSFIRQKKYNDEKVASRSKYEKNDKVKSTSDATQGSLVKNDKMSQTAFQSRYFESNHSTWISKITVASIYLYICSLYVISYSSLKPICDILFVFMVGATVVNTFMNGTRMPMDVPNVMLLAYLIFAILSSTWVVCQEGVDERIISLAELFLLYLIIRLNVTNMVDVRHLLNAVVVGTIIMCIYTIGFYGLGTIVQKISVGDRIGNEVNQVNGMGMYCAICTTIMYYFVLFERKYWYLLFMPLTLFIQIGCGSRKGFMLVLIGVFIISFFRAGNKKALFLIGALLVISIIVYIVYALAEQNYFFYRITQLFALVDNDTELTESSIGNRQEMMEYGIQLWKSKPFFGHGLMQFEYYWSLLTGARRPPHSTYIQILVSFGVTGFVFYYSVYVNFLRHIIANIRKNVRYIVLFLAIIGIMLFNDFGANMMNHKYSYIFFGLIASYVCVLRRLVKEGRTDEPKEFYAGSKYYIPTQEEIENDSLEQTIEKADLKEDIVSSQTTIS